MPALVGHMARLVDGLDVASGGELHVALDAGADPREISFAGPGKTRRRARRRRSPPASSSTSNRCARSALLAAIARALGPCRARRGARQSRLRAQVLGHEDGRRPEAVRHRRRAGAAGARARSARCGLGFEGFHIFSGSQNLRADAICEAQTQDARAGAAAGRARAGAGAQRSTSAAASAFPTFPASSRSTSRRSARNLRDARRAMRARAAAGAARHRARPLPGRRGRRLRVPRRRPQGLARPGLPRHRRRPAPSSRRVRQLRPGDPQELSGGDRQPRRAATRREIASVVGPLCTPLDLLADRMELPRRRPGDLVVVFQSGAYGLTASPLGFLSHPPPAETLA